jgi:CheY-like chemotaxis protein
MTLSLLLTVSLGLGVIAALMLLFRNVQQLRRELSDFKNKSTGTSSSESELSLSRRTVHDLNNLLGTISGFADAASEELPKSSPIRSDLVEILEASERARKLVGKLGHASDKSLPNQDDASFKRTQSYPAPSLNPQKLVRVSSYPPVAKPIPSYEKTKDTEPAANPVSRAWDSQPAALDRRNISKLTMGSYPPPRRDSAVPKQKGKREHLLIVDDELQLLTMFRRIFEPQGYQVTTFSNGLIAWEEFQKHKDSFDLAILDQRMPDMSGTSLAIEMLNSRPDFPIILLSGYSDTISPDDAARIGIRKFLSKPIPQAELSATIRKTLDESPTVAY